LSGSNFIDNFSSKSTDYAFSRPTYPDTLFKFLSELTPRKELAWDCATGNGQAAIGLCKYFRKVIASDASINQIQNKFERENIDYKVFPAEETPLANDSVDLITVAQALHWFNIDKFYSEVKRVGKKEGGIIAVWSYAMHEINPEIDKISSRLDVGGDILGDFWAKEVKYIKELYKTIPFPFKEIAIDTSSSAMPKFKMEVRWNLYQLLSYLQTWSAVKKYYQEKKSDPLDLIRNELKKAWGEEGYKEKSIIWKINLRVGIIN
jgi:ubiquinone/menaquinone biosynthesis C-methylase UbiE